MAHFILIELAGGNDTDIIDAILLRGDQFVFVTADMTHYQSQSKLWEKVSRASHLIESPKFEMPRLLEDLSATRVEFNGVLCVVDIRLIEAAEIADHYGLPFLNIDSALMIRDKATVRRQLENFGIAQPQYRLALSNEDVQRAVDQIGLPCLIKPSDGYGSQNIVLLQSPADLEPWISPIQDLLPSNADYGLGVKANDRLLVESYMPGVVIGCDTMTFYGEHRLLGINEKIFFEPPSFAIQGGTFTPNEGQFSAIEEYVFQVLDALYFNHGAAHIEIMLTQDGLRLIEVNARLVGAKIPRLMSLAFGADVFDWLLDLHLGIGLPPNTRSFKVAASRWITAHVSGTLESVELPQTTSDAIQSVEVLKQTGEFVRPPFENADRIGCVMASAETQARAEQAAEDYVSSVILRIRD